jgi:hypothetical protein
VPARSPKAWADVQKASSGGSSAWGPAGHQNGRFEQQVGAGRRRRGPASQDWQRSVVHACWLVRQGTKRRGGSPCGWAHRRGGGRSAGALAEDWAAREGRAGHVGCRPRPPQGGVGEPSTPCLCANRTTQQKGRGLLPKGPARARRLPDSGEATARARTHAPGHCQFSVGPRSPCLLRTKAQLRSAPNAACGAAPAPVPPRPPPPQPLAAR